MMEAFQISGNEEEFCYNPLVCSTNNSFIIAWAENVNKTSKLMVKSLDKDVNEIQDLDVDNRLLFLRKYSNDRYALAVSRYNDTVLFLLDENANVCNEFVYKSRNELLACHVINDTPTLFVYCYKTNTLQVITTDYGWEDFFINKTYKRVHSIPQVIGNMFGYIDANYTLIVCTNDKCTTLENYDVEFLLSAPVNDKTVVFGGYDKGTSEFCLDFFNTDGKHLYSKKMREDYEGMELHFEGLQNGFMLLADSPKEQVLGQRFTHLGGYLYPLKTFSNVPESCWSPELATNDRTLLIYIRYFKEYSQVWGEFVPISTIPEIADLSIEDN